MPVTRNTSDEVKRLYLEYKRMSSDFHNLHSSILAENPKILVLFRTMLGLSQPKFAELMKIDDANLSKYESGKIKKMQFKTAEKYTAVFAKHLKGSPSLKATLKNFERFKRESQGWFAANTAKAEALAARRLGAANLLVKKLTEQESKVSKLLAEAGISFKANYYFDEKLGIVVDFWLPSKNIVIECKHLTSENRREIRDQIGKLALQGYKIKFNHKVKLLALVEIPRQLWPRELQELKGPFDIVFTEPRKLVYFLQT